jgi:hypothetical protein
MGLSVDIPADAHVVMTNIETGEVIEPLHEGFKLVFKATIDEPQSRGYVMSCLSYVEGQQRNPNFRLMVTAEDMKRFSVVYTPRQMLKRHIRDLTKAAFQASKQELVAAFKENVDLIKRTLSKPLRKPAIALLRVKLKRDIQRAHGEAKRSVRRSVDKRALLAEFALSPKLRETIRFDVVQNVTRCQMGPVH